MSLGPVATMLIVPPLNLLPLAAGGLVLARWRPRLGIGVAALAVALLWAFSLMGVSDRLTAALEAGILPAPGPPPQAIVILSAEMLHGGPGGLVTGYDVGELTLTRLRAGARLARQTGLPVLVSGGRPSARKPTLASLMAASLQRDFAVAARWQEGGSQDTWQNAADTAAILRPAGITRVYLVTSAWHMRRALVAFRAAGLDPVAAPSRMAPPDEGGVSMADWVPTSQGFTGSYLAMHEWLGWVVYLLRARFG